MVMRRPVKKNNLYLLGIFVLGLAYYPIKDAIPDGLGFVGVMLSLALLVAWLAHKYGK
jgi:hypothetical protein